MRKAIATALEAARLCAGAGYAVVPLQPRDKRPRVKNWTECASTDPVQLERWFTKWPDSNLGLMPPEGCIVIDVDPRNGGNADLLRLPKNTPTQCTGGGGWHFVVRVDPGVELPALPGVDYIHPGRQQFCAWPSVHPNGKRYEWVKGLEPWTVKPVRWRPPKASHGPTPAQAPAGDSQRGGLAPIPTAKPPSYTLARLRDLGLTVHNLAPDHWGDHKHAAWVHEWLMPVHYETRGSAEGLALAHEVSALFGNYDPDVLDAKWRSFGKKPRDKLRTGSTLEGVVRKLQGAGNTQRAATGLHMVQLADFARAARAAVWLLRKWLPAGALAVLLGGTNAGKSAVMIALAMTIAAGRALFCGQAVRAIGAVVYIIAEGQWGMAARARVYAEKVLGLSLDELADVPLFFIPVAVSLALDDEVDRIADLTLTTIRDWAAARGVEPPAVLLVVVDTLARNIGGDAHESDNADMSRVMNNCGALQQRLSVLSDQGQQPALVLNAHPGHSAKDRVRGAYAVEAAADVVLQLEVMTCKAPDPEADELHDLIGGPVPVGSPRVLRVTKARDGAPPPPLQLRLMQESPEWLRDPETGESNSTVYLAAHAEFDAVSGPLRDRNATDVQVLRLLLDQGATASRRQLADALGIKRQTLDGRLKVMEGRGLVSKKGDRYAVTAKGVALCA